MIIAAANWLISDGSVSRPPRPESVSAFLGAVGGLAVRAGLRMDGRYEPVREIAVVLAGDTFDRLASRRWLGRVKPWHAGRAAREIEREVDLGILRNARRPLLPLIRLVTRGATVPSADRRSRPDFAAPVRVPVRLAVLEGDRDAGLSLATALGENRWRDLFVPGRPGGGAVSVGSRFLGEHAASGRSGLRIDIRHGQEFDPCCQTATEPEDARDGLREPAGRPTLAESVHVDLVTRFAWGLSASACRREGRLAEPLRRSLVRTLSACGTLDLPDRLEAWLVAATRSPPAPCGAAAIDARLATAVRDAWRRSVDHWRLAARIEEPCPVPGIDVVDAVAARLGALEARGPVVGERDWLRIDRSGVRAAIHSIAAAGVPAGGASPAACLVLGHPPAGSVEGDDLPVVLLGSPVTHTHPATARSRKAWGALVVDPNPPAGTEFGWAAIAAGTLPPGVLSGGQKPLRTAA
jgi:hypothetical protein